MSPGDAANFERTLELGRELAATLDSSDVLGRWMAHHLSDLVTRAEASTGEPGSEDLLTATREAILALWRHRAAAPLRSRPTYTLDQVLAATARLSDDEPGHFYNLFRRGSEPGRAELDSIRLLRTAIELETLIREFVEQAVLRALKEATEAEKKWLQLSDHLDGDDQRQSHRVLLDLQARVRRRQRSQDAKDDPAEVLDDVHLASLRKYAEALLELLRTESRPKATAVKATEE